MPSFNFIDEKYKNSPCNTDFASDLEWMVKENANIKYWIFGHTHTSWNSKLNECQDICNPMGYLEETPVPHVENSMYEMDLVYYT